MAYGALVVSVGGLIVDAIIHTECDRRAGKQHVWKIVFDQWSSESGNKVVAG
jgi:hypothetical protein